MSGFQPGQTLNSWGGVLRELHAVAWPNWTDELPALAAEAQRRGGGLLATGLRRSYGDSCLNPGGNLLDMTALDRVIAFDPATRLLRAEAGTSFAALLELLVPRGFFLPVIPGTRYVTLGGAIANDVHGKNHHRNGTFGRWVRRLKLLRSDGQVFELTPEDETGLFAATIGGLGLTGVIVWAEIEVVPVASAMIDVETIPFATLGEFFNLSRESEAQFEHTVAWVDSLAKGEDLGRGVFIRGNHSRSGPSKPTAGKRRISLPFTLPGVLLNQRVVRASNALYLRHKSWRAGRGTVSASSFFHPLDGIGHWNRAYGRSGFYQYQSVIPPEGQEAVTKEMLGAVAASGQGSFLSVLKTFGPLASPGFLSFPREGTTLAMDFPNRGEVTLRLMEALDSIVLKADGRLYPAKDGRSPAGMFAAGYPGWQRVTPHLDPGMRSHFLKRVTRS